MVRGWSLRVFPDRGGRGMSLCFLRRWVDHCGSGSSISILEPPIHLLYSLGSEIQTRHLLRHVYCWSLPRRRPIQDKRFRRVEVESGMVLPVSIETLLGLRQSPNVVLPLLRRHLPRL